MDKRKTPSPITTLSGLSDSAKIAVARALVLNGRIHPSGCWEWTGKTSVDGYGVMRVGRVATKPSRAMWLLLKGEVPELPGTLGAVVCHKCDNKLCFNPDHLFIGTQAENIADRVAKGRCAHGERCAKAKITNEQAKRIIELRRSGAKLSELSRAFGIGVSAVSHICTGRNWKRLHAQ